MDEVINISSRLAKPIIFLAMDPLIAESGSQEHDTQMSQDVRATDKPRRTDVTLRQTEAYQTALKYAYQKNGCMKLFSANEDRGLIRSGDVFIYVGPKSEKISQILQDMVDIQTFSGLEAINALEKGSKRGAN